MKYAILLLAFLAPAATPQVEPVEDDCADGIYVVIEQNPVRYAGPYCAEGETCVTPADWDDREFLPDGSARYVFTCVD